MIIVVLGRFGPVAQKGKVVNRQTITCPNPVWLTQLSLQKLWTGSSDLIHFVTFVVYIPAGVLQGREAKVQLGLKA